MTKRRESEADKTAEIKEALMPMKYFKRPNDDRSKPEWLFRWPTELAPHLSVEAFIDGEWVPRHGMYRWVLAGCWGNDCNCDHDWDTEDISEETAMQIVRQRMEKEAQK